ncbi:alpha-1,2-fucosyltransferase [Polaribacter sp. IC073]|uniref:alpha-1,2-fucosyltransferase n=1 Tax=Polaribacter sp. IC073 TaxID=2508540 RepID=UPI0011BEB29F|nr:alpha-1,2-fucosyltransferase [Polaribacter sp. IC073]TXD46420.1 alpha-1,2-fucosyltransferase [Polaribacter sp. IC073]
MVIVRILGGLGNQMFQYAYAKSLEVKGFDVSLDLSGFKNYKLHGGYQLDKYHINLQNAKNSTVLFSRINPLKTIKEENLLFNEKLLSLKGNEYVKGYFQTEKYFSGIRNTLLEQFTINREIANSTKKYKKEITLAENSCSIHIRRGDYVSDSKSNIIHGTCTLDYYREAIKKVEEKYKNTLFFVFSDDIPWTKENLVIKNATYINHKCLPHEDILLMSLCKNNITANSSFSWWGAWLNKNNSKMVVAPKQWFVSKENEITCKNWIKI